jgi:AcrR family transcriptional regulator
MNAPALTRHERRRLQTRQQLIQATLDLVLSKGYGSVSVQDITDRADLGRGTFYIHFKDKDEVLWTAFQDLFGRLESEAHTQLDRDTPQAEYYGLLNIFQHAEQNRDLYRVLFGSQGSALLTSRAQDFLARAFRDDIRQARPPQVDFHLPEEFEAQLLTGMVSRLLHWWLEDPGRYSAQQMATMTYQALYRRQVPSPPPAANTATKKKGRM